MQQVFVTGTTTTTTFNGTGGGSVVVQKGATVNVAAGGPALHLLDGAWTVTIAGLIAGASTWQGIFLGVSDLTPNSKITVAKDADAIGSGAGGIGIQTKQALDIVNSGEISGKEVAIEITADVLASHAFTITNNHGAAIYGSTFAIHEVSLATMTIKNAGIIDAQVEADYTDAIAAAGAAKITNTGAIFGSILLGNFIDTLHNTGMISGDVALHDGNDTLVNSGTVTGLIDLGTGDDKFTGGGKSETVTDNDGTDNYKFGGGDDIFLANNGAGLDGVDKVDGGAGKFDTWSAALSDSLVLVNLGSAAVDVSGTIVSAREARGGGVGIDQISGFEYIVGSAFADTLIAGNGAVELYGGAGNDDLRGGVGNDFLLGGDDQDTLHGNGGKDKLLGGQGGDHLFGGAGADFLTGGSENDYFMFLSLKDSGPTAATRDTIHDFEGAGALGGDLIELPGLGFSWQGMDALFTHQPGQLHAHFVGTQTLIEGDANGDGKVDFSIALDGNLTLAASDFVL